MIYPDFDLNLLRALDALIAEASVTRAARRVGVTQPAMSRSLARLRGAFGDPLLVRGPGGMELTSRAQALAGPIRRILDSVREAVNQGADFDPATSERRFTLATADYVELLVLPALLARLAGQAPRIDLVVRRDVNVAAELGSDTDVDVVIGPLGGTSAARQQVLFRETFACIVRRDHPGVGARLSRKRFAALPHLLVAPGGRPGGVVDDVLRRHGLRRRVALRVASFLIAPEVVANSDLVATVPRRLADRFAERLPLRILPPPLEIPGFTIAQLWHPRVDGEPGHRWLRRQIAAASDP